MRQWIWILTAVPTWAGCASSVDVPTAPDDPTGIWRFSDADAEVTLELNADGTFERVTALFALMECGRTSGTWTVDEDRLELVLDATSGGTVDRFTFAVSAGLSLVDPGGERLFSRRSSGASCVDYGYGEWEGVLTAKIDGEDRSFGDIEIDVDIEGGSLRLTSRWRECPTCPAEAPELVLALEAPERLVVRTYTVQNSPAAENTMFGFFHPDPGNPDFEGFSTERLSPPGEFALTAVADERVAGTFSFRGNPRSDGDVAPDGSTSTLVTDGVVDLTYR